MQNLTTPISDNLRSLCADSCHWDGEGPYPIDDFNPRFKAWLKPGATPQIQVAADSSARFGDAVRLLDAVRRQGVQSAQFDIRVWRAR